jgi:hypothetical protein
MRNNKLSYREGTYGFSAWSLDTEKMFWLMDKLRSHQVPFEWEKPPAPRRGHFYYKIFVEAVDLDNLVSLIGLAGLRSIQFKAADFGAAFD